MRYQGKITDWKDDRGFGFITPGGGGTPVFLHISAFKKGQQRPAGNEPVTYELLNDPKRGFRAHNVVLFGVFQPFVRAKEHRTLKPVMVALLVTGIGSILGSTFRPMALKFYPVSSQCSELKTQPNSNAKVSGTAQK